MKNTGIPDATNIYNSIDDAETAASDVNVTILYEVRAKFRFSHLRLLGLYQFTSITGPALCGPFWTLFGDLFVDLFV